MTTSSKHNYAVIMAGGSGTRLWPLSRKDLPKQMQKFITDKTLINDTVERLTGFLPKENIFISTTTNYADKIKDLLPEIPAENIVVEPVARGTAAALALVSSVVYKRDNEAVVFYLASDHAVTDVDKFQHTLEDTFRYVNDNPKDIALIGIKPTRPDTGLGYIKMDKQISEDPQVFEVDKFIEKPSLEVAKKYVEGGEYYWNAAYYCFKVETLRKAYHEADPALIDAAEAYLESKNIDDFMMSPDKVHEIEIIDPSKYRMVMVPADFSWSDIGNWRTLHEVLAGLQADGSSLVTHAGSRHVDMNSANCLIMSTEDKLIATVGLDNLVVVDTPDVLLVLNKEKPQEIKDLLESLKEQGLTEYL